MHGIDADHVPMDGIDGINSMWEGSSDGQPEAGITGIERRVVDPLDDDGGDSFRQRMDDVMYDGSDGGMDMSESQLSLPQIDQLPQSQSLSPQDISKKQARRDALYDELRSIFTDEVERDRR